MRSDDANAIIPQQLQTDQGRIFFYRDAAGRLKVDCTSNRLDHPPVHPGLTIAYSWKSDYVTDERSMLPKRLQIESKGCDDGFFSPSDDDTDYLEKKARRHK